MTSPSQKRKRPHNRADWDEIYIDGMLPWDSGIPDAYLQEVIDRYDIKPGKALEIGCGTGTNSIWLAERGFEVTGTDISHVAIHKAEERAAAAGVHPNFLAGDFLAVQVPGAPFEFVYDRGCFHVFNRAKDQSRFAARVGELIGQDGIWHSLIGSTDGPPRDTGPPRHSATEVTTAVEPHFEILELISTNFDHDGRRRARAWLLVARKRVVYPD